MQNNRLVLLLVGTCTLVSGICAFVVFDRPAGDAEAAGESIEVQRQVQELEAQLTQVRGQLTALNSQLARSAGASGQVQRQLSTSQIERMVEDEVTKRLAALHSGPVEALAEELAAGAADPQTVLDDALAAFLNPTLDFDDREASWDAIKEAGMIEEAIAMLEQEVAANPDNEELAVQLGYAYLQPIIRDNVSGMDAGKWSMKADATYDSVLEMNPNNWDARFSKAVSYSFWPPMFGKQKDAIKHFEILVDQQASQPSDPKYAQTYLLLGNLYSQTGETDKAMDAWTQGNSLYPDDAELRAQLEQ